MRVTLWILALTVASAGVCTVISDQAIAQPAFKRYFEQKYFTKGSKLDAFHTRSSCNFCHVGGPPVGAMLNNYGKTLARWLTKEDADAISFRVKAKDPERYQAAEERILRVLEWAESQPSNPMVEDSPRFGELIKSGRLPITP
jgi:hypothetical protein